MRSSKRQCKFISMLRTLAFGTEIQLCGATEKWSEFLSYQDVVPAKAQTHTFALAFLFFGSTAL